MRGSTRSFSGKTAVVTGGGSGIGLRMGARLFAAGAHVTLADIDLERARSAAAELASRTAGPGSVPGSIAAVALDVRDEEMVTAVVDDVVARHGRLDMMFNNAGVVIGGPTTAMTRAHWARVIDVNLNGVVNGVLASYPLMVRQGDGHIVNTASTAGLAPAVLVAAYSASKHAVVGLTGALRAEAAMHGVRVSVLCPGAVDTPILDAALPADLPPLSEPVLTGREYMATVGLRPIDPDRFAEAALKGVARNRAVIVAPASAAAVWYLHRCAPGLVEVVGRRTARRVSRILATRPHGPVNGEDSAVSG